MSTLQGWLCSWEAAEPTGATIEKKNWNHQQQRAHNWINWAEEMTKIPFVVLSIYYFQILVTDTKLLGKHKLVGTKYILIKYIHENI
jgi:hypothetical protein